METFISILRGINVSGHKKVEMAALKALYEELGFEVVTTYIQSGNVIFKSRKNVSENEQITAIERAILAKYGFEVPVIVRSLEEMKQVVLNNPFVKENDIDVEKLHVTFLAAIPEGVKTDAIKNLDYSPDKFIIDGKEIFLYCPGGYGITKLSNNFFENKLKVTATTRIWKTVNKLIELATKV